MFSVCPKCNAYEDQEYLGVVPQKKGFIKIFRCIKCNIYYTKEKKASHVNTKSIQLRKRDAEAILKTRVHCKMCQDFKNNKDVKRVPIDVIDK